MIRDYFLLAFRNLRKRGLRSWLTILGVFIGIAAVVALISMGAGLRTAITGQFGTLAIDILSVQNKGVGFAPPGSTVIEKLHGHDLDIIKSVRGVERVVPRIIRAGILEYNKISGFGYIVDMPESQEDIDFIYDRFQFKTEKGRLLRESDKRKALLGGGFLETEDFEKEFDIGKKIFIKSEKKGEFEVIGILKKTGNMQFNDVIFIMHEDMADIFNVEDEWDLFVVQVQNKDKIENVGEEISRKLRNDRNEKKGEETFDVETPLESISAVNNVLNVVNIIVIGIALISLLVGGIGIANTMYTSVLERTKEIGTMKAVGAQNKYILWIFIIESGLLGLVGGIIGALAGLGAATGISNLANNALGGTLFTINISYSLLTASIGFSFLIGIISGILPAFQGSKLNIVDALRS